MKLSILYTLSVWVAMVAVFGGGGGGGVDAASFDWKLGEWTACSASCGSSGVRVRSVLCWYTPTPTPGVDDAASAETSIAHSYCLSTSDATSDTPVSRESCNTDVACKDETVAGTYVWTSGEWSSCTASSCGFLGERTRSVGCSFEPADGTFFGATDSSNCVDDDATPKPVSSKMCNKEGCTNTHLLAVADWWECTTTCGEGVHARFIACVSLSDDGTIVDTSFVDMTDCAAAVAITPTSEACNADVECPAASDPTTTAAYDPTPSCSSYVWTPSEWSSCSASCGATGTRTRDVACWHIPTGIYAMCARWTGVVDASYCVDVDEIPASSESCNTELSCNGVFGWASGAWSECSALCGSTATRTRDVECTYSSFDDSVSAYVSVSTDASNCANYEVISSSEACNTDVVCSTASDTTGTLSWTSGEWSGCSASCGGGTRTRDVACTHSPFSTYEVSPFSEAVDMSRCVDALGATPLASIEECNVDVVCFDVSWQSTGWSECSTSCGTGTHTRDVVCTLTTGPTTSAPVLASFCAGVGEMPATSEVCNVSCNSSDLLPPGFAEFVWDTGTWTSCSSSCGTGTRDRDVWCGNRATPFEESDCSDDKPATSEVCYADSLCNPILDEPAPFQWETSEWSSCSSSCGSTGTRTRDVSCSYEYFLISDCEDGLSESKPVSSESCNTDVSCGTLDRIVVPDSEWTLYATIDNSKVTSDTYRSGFTSRWIPDTVERCSIHAAYTGDRLRVKVTMGGYVDYFKPTGSLCDMLTSVGQWYYHSYTSSDGPWKAVNGNHSALLGGFKPYGAEDTRNWGPFWGAPIGVHGYHAEGGGCCHVASGDTPQFWRDFTIHVRYVVPVRR